MFTNLTIQSTFKELNGNKFGSLGGFGIYSSPNSTHFFVMDRGDLNILINHEPTGGSPHYRGISYNPSNGLIYVAAYWLNEIQIFTLDLNLIRRLSTSPNYPWSIAESSNQLYVGTYGGIIIVYQNEIIINQFNGCDGNNDVLTSILFDQNGYMATSCYNPTSKLYLFAPNGSFTGKYLTTPDYPQYIGFDSKGRFIQISGYEIIIYNWNEFLIQKNLNENW